MELLKINKKIADLEANLNRHSNEEEHDPESLASKAVIFISTLLSPHHIHHFNYITGEIVVNAAQKCPSEDHILHTCSLTEEISIVQENPERY